VEDLSDSGDAEKASALVETSRATAILHVAIINDFVMVNLF
jgi:hypothetical protein